MNYEKGVLQRKLFMFWRNEFIPGKKKKELMLKMSDYFITKTNFDKWRVSFAKLLQSKSNLQKAENLRLRHLLKQCFYRMAFNRVYRQNSRNLQAEMRENHKKRLCHTMFRGWLGLTHEVQAENEKRAGKNLAVVKNVFYAWKDILGRLKDVKEYQISLRKRFEQRDRDRLISSFNALRRYTRRHRKAADVAKRFAEYRERRVLKAFFEGLWRSSAEERKRIVAGLVKQNEELAVSFPFFLWR